MGLSWGKSVSKFNNSVKNVTFVTEKEIKNIVDKTGEDVLRFVEKATPVKTGKLRGAWHNVKTYRGKKRQVSIINNVKYAIAVEYGTYKIAPRRMLYNSVVKGNKVMKRRLKALKKKMSQKFNGG